MDEIKDAVEDFLDQLFGEQVTTKRITQSEQIKVDKLKRIEINTGSTDVEVLTSQNQGVTLRLDTFEDGPELSYQIKNNVLIIEVRTPKKGNQNLFGGLRHSELQVEIQQDLAESWQLTTGSGDVTMTKILGETLSIRTGAGDIKIGELKLGDIEISTASGDIDARYLYANDFRFQTASGNIDLKGVYGNITGKASSADILLEDSKGEYLSLASTSGDLYCRNSQFDKLKLKTTSGYIDAGKFTTQTLITSSISGDIDCENFFAETVKAKTSSGDLTFIPAKENQMEIEAVSGDVEVRFLEPIKNVGYEVRTHSGEILSNLPFVKNSKNMRTYQFGDGDLQIKIKTISGDIHIL